MKKPWKMGDVPIGATVRRKNENHRIAMIVGASARDDYPKLGCWVQIAGHYEITSVHCVDMLNDFMWRKIGSTRWKECGV